MKIVVLSPHCDDSTFGCGGMLHSTSSNGVKTEVVILTHGTTHMLHSKQEAHSSVRNKEEQDACDALGVGDLRFVSLGEVGCLQVNMQSIAKLDAYLETSNPTHLMVPLPSYNQDHSAVWDIAMACVRPGRRDKVAVYAYETPHNCQDTHGLVGGIDGRHYVPLSPSTMLIKMRALEHYPSQLEGRADSLTSLKASKLLAEVRGMECGSTLAELFYLVRMRSPFENFI